MVTYSVTERRNGIQRRIIVPSWASEIEVTEANGILVVAGTGTTWNQPIDRKYDVWASKDLLSRFDDGRRLPAGLSRTSPHLMFASADAPEKQLEFVKLFGPVLASNVENPEGSVDIVAYQRLDILQIEQQLFSLTFNLCRAVGRLSSWCRLAVVEEERYDKQFGIPRTEESILESTDEDFARGAREFDSFLARRIRLNRSERKELNVMRETIYAILELIDRYPKKALWKYDEPFSWVIPVGFLIRRPRLANRDSLSIYRHANDMLCGIFNLFPVALYHADGMIQQLPSTRPSGIRSVLYFMLRMEYLYRREIRICQRETCGWYFVPERKNMNYCCSACQKAEKAYRSRRSSKTRSPR